MTTSNARTTSITTRLSCKAHAQLRYIQKRLGVKQYAAVIELALEDLYQALPAEEGGV